MSSFQMYGKFCRICCDWKQDSENGTLIRACKCKGILAFVHDICLSKLLEANLCETCDFCHFNYNMEKKLKNVFDWLREDEEERNEMIVIAIFSNIILYALLVGGVLNYFISYFLLWIPIIFLSLFILTYDICYIARQTVIYRQWKETHFNITVKPNPEHITYPTSQPLVATGKTELLSEIRRGKDEAVTQQQSETASTSTTDSSRTSSSTSASTTTENSTKLEDGKTASRTSNSDQTKEAANSPKDVTSKKKD